MTLPLLPRRDPSGHKGSFGTVAVFGGCTSDGRLMVGAPALAALAALRAGAGLARLFMPRDALEAGLVICPSATGRALDTNPAGDLIAHLAAERFDDAADESHAIVVGPGLGTGPGAQALALRAAGCDRCPIILDADALNSLADVPELARDFRAAAVLTPHPGEYRRLAGSLGISLDPTDPATRPRAAEALAQRLGCIVVLKGAGTAVSNGQQTWTNSTGGHELATAGTGDTLAGLIAGLAAQHVRLGTPLGPSNAADRPALSLFDAARIAVAAHGRAGDLWRERAHASAGLLAAELADLFPAALEPLRER
ncbi:MAG: NAD(P)H-hydrate dehydratase [Phycisphaerales bacterium]